MLEKETEKSDARKVAVLMKGYLQSMMIIPGLFEPPVRTLRATIPENESHIFR